MNEVNIAISGIRTPEWLERCENFALKVLKKRDINNWEVSILLCNNRIIKDLNRRYRGIDKATNVLSFRQGQDPEVCPRPQEQAVQGGECSIQLAGDIIISMETLDRNEEEFKRALIHGLLHLEGLVHDDKESESEMIAIQERILKELIKERIF